MKIREYEMKYDTMGNRSVSRRGGDGGGDTGVVNVAYQNVNVSTISITTPHSSDGTVSSASGVPSFQY
jgi:hypothetical protein